VAAGEVLGVADGDPGVVGDETAQDRAQAEEGADGSGADDGGRHADGLRPGGPAARGRPGRARLPAGCDRHDPPPAGHVSGRCGAARWSPRHTSSRLVDLLSSTWGVDPVPDEQGPGKEVWFELRR
jgi:hypothetical protein